MNTIRKPKLEETLVMLFAVYVWFTLVIEPNLFESRIDLGGNSVYGTYVGLVGNQNNLALISLGVAFLYLIGLFIRHVNILIFIHIIGMIYYAFITASFLLNYPNIGLGVLGLVSFWLLYQIYSEIDMSEEIKKQKIKARNGLLEGGEEE